MKFIVIFAALVAFCEAFGPISLTISGAALAGLFGVKLLAAKGVAVGAAFGAASRRGGGRRHGGSRRGFRFGRSAEDSFEEILLSASVNDMDDCGKKMICMVNAKPAYALASDEKAVYNLFNNNFQGLDLASDSIEFDTAALIGRKVGSNQCTKIYSRCKYTASELLDAFRSTNSV